MYKRIVFATSNEGKIKEIKNILKEFQVEVISMKEAGISAEVEETGETFEENAVLKANAIRDITGEIVLADDSGLEIDYLNKAPGVYSARFAGENTSYKIKNQMIVDKLKDVPDDLRTARFVCVIAAALPNNETITKRGVIEGIIGYEEKGVNGFGYDPIFYLPKYGLTTAELSEEEKNKISHRGKALRDMVSELVKRKIIIKGKNK